MIMNSYAHPRKISILIFSIFIIFSSTGISQNQSKVSREEYNEFIMSHPFMKREKMTKQELKKIPKYDRPDLAWEQDFLTTLDPATGSPEKSRLFPTLDIIDQMQSTLTPAAPGSSTSSSWVERGPNNVAGRTRALTWDPNDLTGKKVWAGSVTGGLWYNNDITSSSSQWQSVNDFWDNIAVTCIAFDPNNSQIVYVGTGEGYGSTSTSRGAGVWKSTNGGSTWARLTSTNSWYFINDIKVRNESNTSVVYVAVDGNFYNGAWHGAADAGLHRSIDGGTTWGTNQVLPNIPSETINYVASDIEIGANNRLWIGTRRSPFGATDRGGGRVLYSDNGTTWTTAYSSSVTNGYGRVELACAPSNANYVYALIENQNIVHEIKRTINGGTSWTSLSEPNDDDLGIPATDFSRNQAWYDLIMAVDPNNVNRVIVGAINAHMTTNGGTSWDQISKWSNNPNMGTQNYSYIHADHHNIVFKPGNSNEVIFGTDGGVFWTNNLSNAPTSAVFQARNNGYNVTQFFAGAINPIAGSNIMVAGAQDNGTQRYSSSGVNSTTEISGGDGAYCFIDQSNGVHVVTSYVYNNYYYHNNSGASYVRKILDNSNAGMFINPADLDDVNNILYTSLRSGEVYKLSNYNLSNYSLDSISITGISGMPNAIKVSPYNSSANVYVGDVSGNLVKINNANGSSPTFTNLTASAFPNGSISSIEFGTSESQIIVTFKNYGVTSVFYSSNGGTTWVSKEGNLPDMPVRWALINPNNVDEVILATEVGVWATTNFSASSPSWVPSNSGLANVRVDMLQHRVSDNTVMAITHGRGVFTSNAWNSATSNQLPFRKINEIKTVDVTGLPDSLNVECKIRGIVTSIDFDGNAGYNFFVQDTTGGIYIYSFADLNNYQVAIGDDIRIIGKVQQFNGLTEFIPDSIAFISSNNQVPSPQWQFGVGESDEGNLVQLNYCQLVNPSAWPTTAGSHNVDIINGIGDTIIMRFDADANLIPSLSAPTGYFSIVGCISQFDNSSPYLEGRQIFPRFLSDVIPAVNVRLSVDMTEEIVSANGVHLAGSFMNGNPNLPNWNPSGIQLFDSTTSGLYETVLTLSQGYYEFKFINGNTWGNDEVIIGCNANGGTNRYMQVTSDTSLPSFCFESCQECVTDDTLYAFDFANGLPTGWSNIGDTSTALWEYRGPSTTPNNSIGSRGAFSGAQSPISSQSANNGFMIFDSDYLDDPTGSAGAGVSPAPHVGSIRTQNFNFSNEQNVILQFESYYRTYQARVGVAISTNGGTSYPDTVFVHEFLAPNQATSTADLLRLDLSSFIGGQANVKLAFVFDGNICNNFGCSYYFWIIDDVKLLRTPNNDLNLFESNYLVGNYLGRYAKMPQGLVPPISFYGNILNEGQKAQPGTKVNFTGNGFSYSTSSLSLAPDSFIYLTSTSNFNAFQPGTFNFLSTAVSDSTEQFPDNNQVNIGFEITDSTFNLSSGFNNEFLGTNSWANASDTFIVANILELQDSVYLNSVEVNIAFGSTPGGKIQIQVWDAATQTFGGGTQFTNPLTLNSTLYTITSSDINSGVVKLPISGSGNAKKLLPGSYYVGAVLYGNNNADTIRVGSDLNIAQNNDASVIYIPSTSGFGGVYSNGNAFDLAINVSAISPNTLPQLPTANGDTLYKYDFNAGLPNNWLNQGDTSTSLWEYRGPNTTPNNSIGSRGAFAGGTTFIQSATNSNGFMIFDSDYLDDPNGGNGLGVSPAPHLGALYTEALNFGNEQNVILQFESYFRAFESAAGVIFSTDGGLTYPDTIYIHETLPFNQASSNPELIRLDVSNYIGGQPNAKIAFIFDGTNPLGLNGGQFQRGYYFWMIDDITFLIKPQTDLVAYDVHVKQPFTIGEHQAIPSFLFNSWEMTGKVINNGATQATNVSLYCQTELGSGGFVPNFTSTTQAILNAADTSGVFNYMNFGFNTIDNYDLIFYPTSDSTDNFTLGDTITANVDVTNNEYRLHRNVWSSAFGTNFNTGAGSSDSLLVLNEFYFKQQAQLNQITIDIGSASRVGAEVFPVVYQGNFGVGFTEVYRGSPYTITATDTINFNAFIPTNFVIDTGLYYVGVMLNSNNNSNNVTIIDDQSYAQNPNASIIRLGGIFYNNGNAFHLTLNLNQPQVLAQIDLPITWDDTANVDYTVTDFSGTTSSLVSDPLNTSNLVIKTDKSPGGQPWQGTTLSTPNGLANPVPFVQGATTITAVVYSPDSGIVVRLKAEDKSNNAITVETEIYTTKANAWDTLIFDFANHIPTTAAINFANTYDMVTIFYDFNNNPSNTKTYYVDDVYFGGTISSIAKAQIDLPITWDDTANVDYTLTDFSGTTSSLVSDPLNTSNLVIKTDKSPGGQPWQGTTLSTSNGLANPVPFAQGATTISAVVYSPDSGIVVRLKAEDKSNNAITVETEVYTTKANAWDTLIFDFANHVPTTAAINFANTYDMVTIFYDFNNNPSTTKTYYVDDIYFGGTPPVVTHNVTFQVDMKYVLQAYTTPELNGTFNNWCGNCNQMSDSNNDSIWDITIQLPVGSYEYKFAADNWGIDEQLTQGASCTVTNGGFTNRTLTITGDTVLPVVCWESCVACSAAPPSVYNVTFQVDMQNVLVPFTTPELNGTFNSWCGNCNAMTDANNDNIWEVTVQIPADTVEYKFAADNWAIQEILAQGLSCTVTNGGFTNRVVAITGDTTLPVVCWETCQACVPLCPSLNLSATQNLVTCFGGNNGILTAFANGGNAPYIYDWGFSQSQTISGLLSGNYSVTVTDSSGCVDSAVFFLNQPTGPLTSVTNGSLPILEINNTNGTSYLMDFGFPDSTSWGSTVSTVSAFSQLVVARDSSAADSLVCSTSLANAAAINGKIAVVYRGACEFGLKALACQNAGALGVIVINNINVNTNISGGLLGTQVNIPVMMVTQNNGQIIRNLMKNGGSVYMGENTNAPIEPLCFGNMNGSIELNVNGGTSPYSYQWSNNQGSRIITGIGAGTYSYTITDGNSCVHAGSTTLNQPQALQIGLTSAQNPTSLLANNGSITVNASGGTNPYTYSWNTSPVQTSNTASNLNVGNYSVTVTDSNLCNETFNYSLCANDTTTSSVSICQGDTAFIFGNAQTTSGSYFQTFTSNAGCDSVLEVSLTVNSNPLIGGVNVTQVSGCGTNDGAISLLGFGAGTITYSLNTGQIQTGNGSFTGLFPATYVVTVTDSLGCSSQTGQLTISPFAGSPNQPTITGTSSFNYCFGDAIQTVSATGGSGTLYWYDNASLTTPIDSGSTYTPNSNLGLSIYYVAEFASNCQGPPAQIFVEVNAVPNAPILTGGATYCDTDPISPIFAQGVGVVWYGDTGLTAVIGTGSQMPIGVFANVGVNYVYATSTSNGCVSAASSDSVIVLASPQPPSATSVAYCDNESSIALAANLATGNSARWYSDSTLNNLISVNQSFFPSSNVGSSTFYLTQNDGTCESQSVPVTSTVYQSPIFTSVISNDVSSCGLIDGSIFITAQFSNIGSKYSIDNGQSFQQNGSFNNLPAAGYILYVEDTFCSSTYGIETINAPGQPQSPTVLGDDTICNGDSFGIFAASASGSGTLTWYDSPLLGISNQVDTGITYSPQSVGLGANTYYVTETQGNCEGAAASVTILVNALPNVNAGIDQFICDGNSAILVATGASVYNWIGLGNNDSVTVSPTSNTQYNVIGTSAQGCVNSDSVLVSINTLPTVTAGAMPGLCIDQGNFILPKATPNGGQYSGQNIVNNTLFVSQVGVGTHPVYYTYTDNNGCTAIDTSSITVNALPIVSLGQQSNICANAAPISLTGGLPSGGSYFGQGIANGNFDPTAVAGPGMYSIFYSFTDLNGCFARDTNTITIDTVPIISWISFPTICEEDAKYTLVEAIPSGGVYSGNGVGGGSFDPVFAGGAGAYSIGYSFTDGNGCEASSNQTLNVGVVPIVNLGSDTTLCNNIPTVVLDAGSGSSYAWFLNGVSTGQTSQTITADSSTAGSYSVFLTNSDGCSGSDTVVVSYESICLGISGIGKLDAKVNIFPNPNNGNFILEIIGEKAENIDVEIYSSNGQLVYQKAYNQQSLIREEIELRNLSGGIYILNLKTEKGNSKFKLIIN